MPQDMQADSAECSPSPAPPLPPQGLLDAIFQTPTIRALLAILVLVFFTNDLRRIYGGTHTGWHHTAAAPAAAARQAPAPQAPPATPAAAAAAASAAAAAAAARAPPGANAACLATQLALGRAGRMLEASLTPRAASPRALGIAVPVYPPHFHFLLNYLAPHGAAEAAGEPPLPWDLFPIFSTPEDAAAFAALLAANASLAPLARHYTPLLLSWDPLVAPRLAATASWGFTPPIVLYKNYHALALLHPCYAHLAVLDAELLILRPRALAEAFAARATGGLVLAGFVPRYRYFNLWSTCMFSAQDRAALAALTRDNCLYSWWSDLPAFVAADVPRFLADIGYPIHFGAPHGHEFGHLAYEQWKVLRGEWRAVDLSDAPVHYGTCGSLEMMGRREDYEAVRAAFPPGPRWLSAAFCALHSALCAGNEALVLLYHLNRGVELLELAARQSCEAQSFNKDPFAEPLRHRQGCVWRNGSRSDVLPPIEHGD